MRKKIEELSEVLKAFRLFLTTFLIIILIFRIWTIVTAQKAVKDYNALLELAYSNMDLQTMKVVATDKELRRLEATFLALDSRKERAEAKLLELQPSSISWGFDSVEVETEEKWFYKILNLVNGKTKRTDVYDYHLAYQLVRTGLDWKVNGIRILKEMREGI